MSSCLCIGPQQIAFIWFSPTLLSWAHSDRVNDVPMGTLQKIMLQTCNLHNKFVFAQLKTGVFPHHHLCFSDRHCHYSETHGPLYIEHWVRINWRRNAIKKVAYAMMMKENCFTKCFLLEFLSGPTSSKHCILPNRSHVSFQIVSWEIRSNTTTKCNM